MNDLVMNAAATTSLEAAKADPDINVPTAREKEYYEVVKSVVLKPEGHKKMDPPPKPELPRLYTVTTIACSARFGGTRTPVICSTFEKAAEMVENNDGDLYECSYRLVVIEAVVPDHLYTTLHEQYWYVWVYNHKDSVNSEGSYKAIETPEVYKNIVGWGIG